MSMPRVFPSRREHLHRLKFLLVPSRVHHILASMFYIHSSNSSWQRDVHQFAHSALALDRLMPMATSSPTWSALQTPSKNRFFHFARFPQCMHILDHPNTLWKVRSTSTAGPKSQMWLHTRLPGTWFVCSRVRYEAPRRLFGERGERYRWLMTLWQIPQEIKQNV